MKSLYHICTNNFELESTDKFNSEQEALVYFTEILDKKYKNKWICDDNYKEIFVFDVANKLLKYYEINTEVNGSYSLRKKEIEADKLKFCRRVIKNQMLLLEQYEKGYPIFETKWDMINYLNEKKTSSIFNDDKIGYLFVNLNQYTYYKYKFEMKYTKKHNFQLQDLAKNNSSRFYNKIDSQILKIF